MKLFFKIVFGILGFIIAAIGTLIALLYKDVQIDTSSYSDPNRITMDGISDKALGSFDNFLVDATEEAKVGLNISCAEANQLLKDAFDGMSNVGEYVSGEDYSYVYKTDQFGFQGGQVQFSHNQIEIVAGFHAFIGEITFKSGVSISLGLEEVGEEVIFELKDLKVGNLPLLWAKPIANTFVEKASGKSIDTIVNESMQGIGTFNLDKGTFVINIREILVENLSDGTEDNKLPLLILDLIYKNNLLDLSVEETGIDIALVLEKLRDDTTPVTIPDAQKFQTNADVSSYFSGKMTSLLISILTADTPYISLSEETLNKMIAFYFESYTSGMLANLDFNTIKIETLTPYVEIGERLTINIPLKFKSTDSGPNSFDTIIKFEADIKQMGKDLLFSIKNISVGEVSIDDDQIEILLSALDDGGLYVGNSIVIKDFTSMINRENMRVDDIAIVGGELNIKLECLLSETINVADLQQVLGDALAAIAANPDFAEISDEITALLAGGANIDELSEALVDAIDELGDILKNQLFENLENDLIGHSYSLDTIFPSFGE